MTKSEKSCENMADVCRLAHIRTVKECNAKGIKWDKWDKNNDESSYYAKAQRICETCGDYGTIELEEGENLFGMSLDEIEDFKNEDIAMLARENKAMVEALSKLVYTDAQILDIANGAINMSTISTKKLIQRHRKLQDDIEYYLADKDQRYIKKLRELLELERELNLLEER